MRLAVPGRRFLFIHCFHNQRSVVDSAQAFLLPQFGGVVILNAPFASFQSHSYHLSCIALAPAFHLFTQHLYSLLALPSLLYTPNKLHLPPPPSPFHRPSSLMQPLSPWQVHRVLLARLEENFQEGKKTLKGIVRLVRKIGEMKVGEGVRDTVLGAVIRLEKVQVRIRFPFPCLKWALMVYRIAIGQFNRAPGFRPGTRCC